MPFELFLFSYAILGPLHYLTEISWLHKRNYFLPGKNHLYLLGILCFLILLPTAIRLYITFVAHSDVLSTPAYVYALQVGSFMLFVAFATAAILVLLQGTLQRLLAIAFAILIGLLFRSNYIAGLIFTLFLPTLIHVFIFTGAFLLVGALKSRSTSGIISMVVFLAVAIGLFLVNPNPQNHASAGIIERYNSSFLKLNRQIFALLLHKNTSVSELNFSAAGILLTRFIAYAYTYHYLNWFSKTSVIKWHLVPRRSLIVTIAIWLSAVILYLTDYKTGLTVLYFLSMLHVILEFPLNFQSFRDIGRELARHLSPR